MTDDPVLPPLPGRSRPRLIALDVLRGVAVLLVIGRHPVSYTREAGILRPAFSAWNRVGWTGVDLFFVLSGFLIGGLLFEELHERGRLDVRRFLVRRAFKIGPSYYAFLAYLAVSDLLAPNGRGFPLVDLVPCLLNVQNYVGTSPALHLWSLAVEDHFYLGLALLLGGIVHWSGPLAVARGVPRLALALGVACLSARIINAWMRPYHYETHLFPTHLRLDGLAFGVWLACARRFRPKFWERATRRPGRLLGMGLALIAPVYVWTIEGSRFVTTFGLTLLYLGFGAIVVAFVSASDAGRAGRLFGSRAARGLAFVGLSSYPIYLWHLEFGQRPARWLYAGARVAGLPDGGRFLVCMLVEVALAIGAGVVMGRLIERPALRLRERLFPDRLDAAIPAVPRLGDVRQDGSRLDQASTPRSLR